MPGGNGGLDIGGDGVGAPGRHGPGRIVTIVEGDNGAIVGLRTDARAGGAKLDRVVGALAQLGLAEAG